MAFKSGCLPGGFQLAAETSATDFQTAQRCFERLWRLDDFTAGDRCGSLDAQVNAVDLVRRATPIKLRIRHLDLYGHKPTIRGARNRCAQNPAREAQLLGHGDFTDPGQTDRLAFQGELVVGNIKAVAATTLFLEPWLVRFFAPLGEEPFPGFGEIPERLGVGIPVNVLQPRPTVLIEPLRVGVLDGVELFFERHGVWPAACRVLPVPLIERPVPNTPRRAAGALEAVHLLRSRTKSDLVGWLHCWAFLTSFASCFSASSNFFR
ncbi:hypothetical protein Cabther_B0087 [Chloracidobacterium thermophilum B]|uniref:Uncharacterized protein n=1 Tax=Chloracidobacterium thermophilum (strain B) TaxID=981222 RepID=G2LJS6_CHLTF|nr:hypothetical protein Cabther_B0087 [Chloracidobacterium thermophilum B]